MDKYTDLVSLVGGRLSYIAQAATHTDMLGHARQMLATEKAWLQSQIGLIPDCDDDVMDEVCDPCRFDLSIFRQHIPFARPLQQKWSSCSWLLMRDFRR